MAFEITGHKPGLEGAFVRTQAHTAADALRFAREWAEQGLTGITIVNPKGESLRHRRLRDDRQHHGRWPACRPELKARSAPPMRPNLAAGSFGSTPQAHSRSRTGAPRVWRGSSSVALVEADEIAP